MKKTLGVFGLMLLLGSTVFGANLTTNTTNTVQTNCDGGVFNWTYYANKTPTQYLFDTLAGTKDKHYVIGFTSSYANIYNPFSAIQFQSGGAFAYKSEIKPRGVDRVMLVHQNEGEGTNIVGHASKRADIAAQVVFNIARKIENGTQAKTTTYQYMNTDKSTAKVDSNAAFNSNITRDNECLNIYVGRCGDGVIDNGTQTAINDIASSNGQLAGGEQCDNGALNGTPGNTCSATCTTSTGTVTTGSLTLNKSLVTTKTYLSGETVEFRIDFANNTATQADFVILEDVLPNSLEYISSQIFGVTASSGTYTQAGNLVLQYSGFSLKPGQSGYLIVRGKVKAPQCIQNNINWSYLYANKDSKPLVAQAAYSCSTDTPVDPTCQNVSVGTLNADGISRNVVCMGKNTTTTTAITIDCGDGATKQFLPGYASSAGIFSDTCTYTSSSKAKNAKVSCKVANNSCTVSNAACTIDANVRVAIVEDEGNGKVRYTCETKDGTEADLQIVCGNEDNDKSDTVYDSDLSYTCTYTEKDYDRAGSDKTLQAKCIVDGDNSCSVDTVIDKGILSYCGNGIREGYEECDGGDKYGEGEWKGKMCKKGCVLCDECNDEVTQCLSIENGNVSVQKDEILPFWWKMYKPAYIVKENTCEDLSQEGNIKKSSMKCTFSLRQPGATTKPVDIKTVPCDSKELDGHTLFSNFYKPSWDTAFGNWYFDLEKVLKDSDFTKDLYGEYKLRLHKVSYDYCACDGNRKCDWKDTQINNICETDFTITRPYLIQKNAFGTSPKATDAKLSNFFDIIGNPLIKKTDLEDVMVLNENAYTSKTDAKFMIMSEAAQISKLAVKMDSKKLPSSLQNAGMTVKKVPNKAIYLLENTSKNTQTYTVNSTAFTTPFTIITKNINLVIAGDLNVNGMFITQNGKIRFEAGSDDCDSAQIVRGIFVAQNGFDTTEIKNDKLTKKWCQYGNLQVKGILIGDGIDNLVQKRRANLANWFNVSGSEKSIKVQRRNQVFNGASLMIEYNPDLWKALPPGAEQFVNLLDIYKK